MNRIVRSAVFLLPLLVAATPIGAVLLVNSNQPQHIVVAPSPASPSQTLDGVEVEPGQTVPVRFRGHTFSVHVDG